jgi:hypothetical protein
MGLSRLQSQFLRVGIRGLRSGEWLTWQSSLDVHGQCGSGGWPGPHLFCGNFGFRDLSRPAALDGISLGMAAGCLLIFAVYSPILWPRPAPGLGHNGGADPFWLIRRVQENGLAVHRVIRQGRGSEPGMDNFGDYRLQSCA